MTSTCRRCAAEIDWDANNRPINPNSGLPHDIRWCPTIPRHVYCPTCKVPVPQGNPCQHYKQLGYRKGDNEITYIRQIIDAYYRQRKTTAPANRYHPPPQPAPPPAQSTLESFT